MSLVIRHIFCQRWDFDRKYVIVDLARNSLSIPEMSELGDTSYTPEWWLRLKTQPWNHYYRQKWRLKIVIIIWWMILYRIKWRLKNEKPKFFMNSLMQIHRTWSKLTACIEMTSSSCMIMAFSVTWIRRYDRFSSFP